MRTARRDGLIVVGVFTIEARAIKVFAVEVSVADEILAVVALAVDAPVAMDSKIANVIREAARLETVIEAVMLAVKLPAVRLLVAVDVENCEVRSKFKYVVERNRIAQDPLPRSLPMQLASAPTRLLSN